MQSQTTSAKKQLLRAALKANGLSDNWQDWKDTQGLGAAVGALLK